MMFIAGLCGDNPSETQLQWGRQMNGQDPEDTSAAANKWMLDMCSNDTMMMVGAFVGLLTAIANSVRHRPPRPIYRAARARPRVRIRSSRQHNGCPRGRGPMKGLPRRRAHSRIIRPRARWRCHAMTGV